MGSNDKIDELLANQIAMKHQIETLDKKVDRCVACLQGPEGEAELGLTVKVDRLEQTEKARKNIVWVIVAAVVGLICESLWSVIRG